MSWAITAAIFVVSGLYAAVGQAGASGYLAAMALGGLPASVMRPAALVLNVLVSLIASAKFIRAGQFSKDLFWPLAVGSVPLAFVGGLLELPANVYGPVVGVVLLVSAVRLWRQDADREVADSSVPRAFLAMAGGGVGLLSGLTGTGGGVFLGPLLLQANWASPRQAAGVTAPFILVNSLAALAGLASGQNVFAHVRPGWAIAAATGGYLGAAFGISRLSSAVTVKLLAALLLLAALKLLAT